MGPCAKSRGSQESVLHLGASGSDFSDGGSDSTAHFGNHHCLSLTIKCYHLAPPTWPLLHPVILMALRDPRLGSSSSHYNFMYSFIFEIV